MNLNNKPHQKSLRDRKIFTLKQWCQANGHDGVTEQCIMSASGSENKRIVELARKHRLSGIAIKDKIKGEK